MTFTISLHAINQLETAFTKLEGIIEDKIKFTARIAEIDAELAVLNNSAASEYEMPLAVHDFAAFIAEIRLVAERVEKIGGLRNERNLLISKIDSHDLWANTFIPAGIWFKVGEYAFGIQAKTERVFIQSWAKPEVNLLGGYDG